MIPLDHPSYRIADSRLNLVDTLEESWNPPRPRETWRPVPGFEGLYEVSSEGQFRSLYFDPPRLLTHGQDSNGYPTIMLSKDGKRSPFTVHRLVCRAFHGEPFLIWNEAAHLDGDRTNPRADNLKWATKIENHFHMRAHGTHPHGESHPSAKLTKEQADYIRSSQERSGVLAARFGVTPQSITELRAGRTWASSTPPCIAIAAFAALYFIAEFLR